MEKLRMPGFRGFPKAAYLHNGIFLSKDDLEKSRRDDNPAEITKIIGLDENDFLSAPEPIAEEPDAPFISEMRRFRVPIFFYLFVILCYLPIRRHAMRSNKRFLVVSLIYMFRCETRDVVVILHFIRSRAGETLLKYIASIFRVSVIHHIASGMCTGAMFLTDDQHCYPSLFPNVKNPYRLSSRVKKIS